MNIASKRFSYRSNRAAGFLHALIFVYYFTGVEGVQFEEGTVVSKIFLLYKISLGIMVICWILNSIGFIGKIVVCALFIITSVPLIAYIIYPELIEILFGGFLYGPDNFINFNLLALTDLTSIFVFSITFLYEPDRKFELNQS